MDPKTAFQNYDLGEASRDNDSEDTRVQSRSQTSMSAIAPIDKIDRIPQDDKLDSRDGTSNSAATITKAPRGARKSSHPRNRHDLHKQLTEEDFAEGTHKSLDLQEAFPDNDPSSVWHNFYIMLTSFPYWNMAFWSGWCYSIGSALFIIDGAWSWVPLQWPETEFTGESKYGVPLLFFIGACLYQVGGVMAYLEAVNDGCFAGAAMKRLVQGQQGLEREFLDTKLHTFFGHLIPHVRHHGKADRGGQQQQSAGSEPHTKSMEKDSSHGSTDEETKQHVERRGGFDYGPQEERQENKGEVNEYLTWKWWASWHALRTYHIFELGWIACTIQLFGVTLYGVTSIVILPGILDSLQWWQEIAAYWVPQVVASCCFLIASVLFTVMAQDKWYKAKAGAVSWWIGIWAIVGSMGFLLCAIFGLFSNSHTWAGYQSSLSSMWGSFFYMMSGLFQWYEAINVNVGPVLAFPNNRTPVLLRKNHAEDAMV